MLSPPFRRRYSRGLKNAGTDPGSRHSQLNDLKYLGGISQPQVPRLKTNCNYVYLSGLSQGLAEGLLVKLLVGDLAYKRCSFNGDYICNCVMMQTIERLHDTQLLSNGAGIWTWVCQAAVCPLPAPHCPQLSSPGTHQLRQSCSITKAADSREHIARGSCYLKAAS